MFEFLPRKMSEKKLVRVSAAVVQNKKHCLVITMNDSKTDVDVCGDNVWLKALKDKPELLMSLKEALEEAVENRDIDKPLQYETLTSLPRLFAVPGSKKWRGVRIRSQLCK